MLGIDTTSSTLQWFFVHMAQNPDVQEKLSKELTSVFGGGDYDEKLSSKLPYMKQCFKESSRMDAVSSMTIKQLQKDLTLHSGQVVPAGMDLGLCLPILHKDPKYFEEPEKFIPERWTDEAKAERISQGNLIADHPMMFQIFSFGPRMCLGARLASVEMNSLVTRVFQDYKIELAPGQGQVESNARFFIVPKTFPKLVFTPRNK